MFRATFALILLLVAGNSWGLDYKLEITQAQLQQQLSSMMPVKQEKMYVVVTLSDPVLELGVDGNKVGVRVSLDVEAPGGIKATGRAKIVGDVSYKKETGEFFFYKPTIADIQIDQLPEQLHANVKELAQYALSSSIKNKPIFKLQDSDPQQKMAKSMLKSVDILPEKLLITLSVAE